MTTEDHVKIFDTTLRDGEQAPGFSMSTDGKLVIARALRDLKVDIIEAGFAAASPGDARAVRAVAEEIEGPTICSLARLNEADIDAAARAVEPARNKRVHTFIGTSPTHREAKLKMSRDEILERIAISVIAVSAASGHRHRPSAQFAGRLARPPLGRAAEVAGPRAA